MDDLKILSRVYTEEACKLCFIFKCKANLDNNFCKQFSSQNLFEAFYKKKLIIISAIIFLFISQLWLVLITVVTYSLHFFLGPSVMQQT